MGIQIWLLITSIIGVLFSGYASGLKFFSDTCAFGEECPYFLGYPACYFGLAMFIGALILALGMVTGNINIENGARAILWISGIGAIFAGYYVFSNISVLFSHGFIAFITILPACAFGMLVYIALNVCSIIILRQVLGH